MQCLCISQSLNTPRNLGFYFRKDDVGLLEDFRKLSELSTPEGKWVMGFIYPKPDMHQWETTLASVSSDMARWTCVTKLDDYPDYLFIPLWARREE
jgi:hypothetical protein